jgi:hypothetical protein
MTKRTSRQKNNYHIESTSSEHLEELARLVAEANKARWKHKLALHNVCNSLKDKMKDFFSHKDG